VSWVAANLKHAISLHPWAIKTSKSVLRSCAYDNQIQCTFRSLPMHLEALHANQKFYRYLGTSNHSVSSSDRLLVCLQYRSYSMWCSAVARAHHVASALFISSGHSNIQTPESFMLCMRTAKPLRCCQSTNSQSPSLACAGSACNCLSSLYRWKLIPSKIN